MWRLEPNTCTFTRQACSALGNGSRKCHLQSWPRLMLKTKNTPEGIKEVGLPRLHLALNKPSLGLTHNAHSLSSYPTR
jgi:hypothetical protein